MAAVKQELNLGMDASLQMFYEQNKFTDVVVGSTNDAVRIHAHLLVLSACSSFFEEKFVASKESICDEILVEVPGEILKLIIDSFYAGYITINLDNVYSLSAAGKTLRLANLTEICNSYICDNFMEVSKMGTFMDIHKDALITLLSSDKLKVNSEDDVLDALLRWLQHDESHCEHISKLIHYIRVEHLSPSYLADHMDIVERFPKLQALVNKIFVYQNASLKNLPKVFKQPPRGMAETDKTKNQSEATLIAIRAGNVPYERAIYNYCPRENEWTHIMQVFIPSNYYSICTVNDNELIIAGGEIDDKPSDEVFAISLRTKTISSLNSMNTCRKRNKLAVLDGCIYAIGGYSGSESLKTVERLVQNEGAWSSWSYVADMNEERSECAVATLDGLLFATGGVGRTGHILKSVECYIPQRNAWRRCTPMNEERCRHEVAALNNFLYAVGGYNKLSMEKYDPRIDKWTKVCDLSITRSYFACFALNGRLIIAGGWGTDSVTEYNPELNVWTDKRSLPEMVNGKISGALAKNI